MDRKPIKILSFRVSKNWYRDFSDFLTDEGISRTEVFEQLLNVLFYQMAADDMRKLDTRQKFDRAISNLSKL